MLRPLLLLMLVPTASAAAPLEVSGFAFDLSRSGGDDAVAVRNRSDVPLRLADYTLTDGEGVLAFPLGAVLAPGGAIVFSTRAASYLDAAGALPDFALEDLDPAHRMRVIRPGFALARTGDEIRLDGPSGLVDRVVYGTIEPPGPGWNGPPVNASGRTFLRWFERQDAVDDDGATDWASLGIRILGADHWPVFEGTADHVHAYAAPESSRFMVEQTILRTRSHLRLNVYQFRDLGILDTLQRWGAHHPEARLEVLVEGSPVGESRSERQERAHVLRGLQAVGATVREASPARYPYNHAKYVVSDEDVVLVQTENFVPSGIPQDGRSGNRGYGVVLRGPALARQMALVFDEDFRLEAYGAQQPNLPAPSVPPPLAAPMRTTVGPVSSSHGPATVWVLTAPMRPTHADPVLRAIANATSEIRVAHLSLPPSWTDTAGRSQPNPYLAALRDAALRGVRVRLLLDGHFIDADPRILDNEDTRQLVQGEWANPQWQARLHMGPRVLHAKTIVIDEEWSLVGSMNGNANSVLHNREVSVLVRDAAMARLLAGVFDEDWSAAGKTPAAPAPGWAGVGAACVLIVVRWRRDSKPSYRARS